MMPWPRPTSRQRQVINIEIFKLFGTVFLDDETAQKGLDALDKRAAGVGKALGALGKVALGVGAIAGALGGALFAMANKTASAADEIDKMNIRTGISKERLQELRYISAQVDVNFASITNAIARMNMNLASAADGTGTAVNAFKQLDIQLKDATGELRRSEDVFDEAIKKLGSMTNETERNAMAMEIFGRGAVELIPLMNEGAEGLDALTARAHELGQVLEDDTIDAFVVFGDTITDIKLMFNGLIAQISTSVLPWLQKAADWVLDNVPRMVAVFEFLGEVIGIVAKYIKLIINDAIEWLTGNVLTPFAEYMVALWAEYGPDILESVEGLWEGIKEAFSLALSVIGNVWEAFSLAFQGDWAGAWEKVKEIAVDIWTGIPGIFEGLWEPLTGIADGIMQAVLDVIRNVFGDDVADHFESIWDAVLAVFDVFQGTFLGVWRVLDSVFKGEWSEAWNGVKDIAETIWNAMPAIFENAFSGLLGIADSIMQGIITIIRDVFGDNVADAFDSAWQTVIIVFETFRDTVLGLLSVFTSVFRGDWEAAWNGIKDVFEGIWSGITEIFTGPLNSVVDYIAGWADRIVGWFVDVKDRAIQAISDLMDGLKEWFGETKLGKAVEGAQKVVDRVGGWFYNLYDKVVGHSYIPDMVEEIGEAIDRLRVKLANPVRLYTSQALEDFQGLSDGAILAAYAIADAFDDVISSTGAQIGDWITDVTAAFWSGTATWANILVSFGSLVSNTFKTIFNTLVQEMIKSIVAQNTWLAATLANIAASITAFLSQAYAALVAFFWFLGPLAPASAGGVIAVAIAAIAALGGTVLRGIMPSMPGMPDVPGADTPGRGGTQISEITGPTRDLLVTALAPLSSLDSLTGIGARIYDVLLEIRDNVIVGPTPALAGVGGAVTIETINISTANGEPTEISRELVDAIDEELAKRYGDSRRGRGL